ncbi:MULTISPECIES: type VI secretion system Vgr family protein [Halomonadaceae]|uniref:type VI secretion system Vgr family protein n=1 Tax=Halomonadaceae TaxID=28256 RepID=UPI0012EF3A5D|nr:MULTISPECIES: type VI secretion system tip protein VgrG [Halomonas]CAD5248129.1 putative type VI secretion system protein VgrGA [Halomonas sp. 156]CAD5265455.1 putative type VI secretion system protein VgrGA [Halomonas sp. 113]CAD5267544.1 putative type VI secretion system protein VgrGA [Halomonas sp. 59]CAD5280101.1 Putative type VI secretion system protein VgrGA [Halomonas sp. I3]VXB61973.1 putative type VI secretion system protein VgrGA [Halomonas titanicae]
MANGNGLSFTLTLPGVDDVAVVDFTHREALSAPFELTLNFASRNGQLNAAELLDRNATLTVWHSGEALRHIHGIVSEFSQGDRGHRRTFYSLVLRPALWRLSLRHNSRIFQKVTPITIITTLCQERGISDITFDVTREPVEREYCVQYRETDLAFIERLAAEEGLFYYHTFEAGSHRLIFSDDPKMLSTLGERTYHSRAGGTPPTRHVRKLRQTARVASSSAMLKDYTFKNPGYAQLHEHQGRDIEQHGQRADYEHYDYPGRYKRDASGKPFTRTRLEYLRREAITAHAESDLPELAPGMRFTLTDHDADALNRDWQLIEATHYGEQPQALEEDSISSSDKGGMTRYYNTLVLGPGDTAWRATPNPKPRVDGPQVAFVVGPPGEEIYCDEYGRVKVQFPWDRYAEPNEKASCWVRVSQGWAGAGYGSIAIPRIGHEVTISFLEGDPDQPLITGRTYHAANTAPYLLPEHKTRTTIKTQTHQGEGFNELCFEDKAGEEFIYMHAQKNLELHVLNSRQKRVEFDDTATIGNNSHLAVAKDRVETIDGNRDITVRTNHTEQVDGDRGLTVGGSYQTHANGDITFKADGELILDASKITLVAGGAALVVGGGSVDVTPVLNVGSASPSAAALPSIPAVLEAAAGEGSPFVSHCPLEGE